MASSPTWPLPRALLKIVCHVVDGAPRVAPSSHALRRVSTSAHQQPCLRHGSVRAVAPTLRTAAHHRRPAAAAGTAHRASPSLSTRSSACRRLRTCASAAVPETRVCAGSRPRSVCCPASSAGSGGWDGAPRVAPPSHALQRVSSFAHLHIGRGQPQ